MHSVLFQKHIIDNLFVLQVKYRFLSIDKEHDFVTIYDCWFTKLSSAEFDNIASDYEFFQLMNDNFDNAGCSGRFHEFFRNEESFSVIDVWDNSFNHYLDVLQ